MGLRLRRLKSLQQLLGALERFNGLIPLGLLLLELSTVLVKLSGLLEVGQIHVRRHLRKVVSDEDIEMFAQVSTDHNPVHLNDEYAQDTIFEGRIAHGMLTAGLISAVIGEQLPGHGTVYIGQTLKFLAPVRPGDMVYAEVKVIDIEKKMVDFVLQ